ncbi:MAG: YkgJ family cysteine cluster protein [Deltaproteobacteria bacterium]|nr:YkgJ family cysteine cluster protein [Deltaproteobacteria bacterium]
MIHRLLKTWHKQIPAMQCESGCRQCCEGYAPSMLLAEWREIKHPGKILKEIGLLESCPFLGESGCEIYPRRPLVCRIFGTVAKAELEEKKVAVSLPVFCPRGCEPPEPLKAGAALGLQVHYQRLLNAQLREVAADFRQCQQIRQEDEPLPAKFEWLYYVLCTRDGQHNYRQLMGRALPALNQEDLGRLAAVMGG